MCCKYIFREHYISGALSHPTPHTWGLLCLIASLLNCLEYWPQKWKTFFHWSWVWLCDFVSLCVSNVTVVSYSPAKPLFFPSPWWSGWWRRYFSNLKTWTGAQLVVAMRSVIPLIFLSRCFIFTSSLPLLIKRGERDHHCAGGKVTNYCAHTALAICLIA